MTVGGPVVRVKISGVNTVRKLLANGETATYYYHRSTGSRLKGLPGSPDFIASYAKAESTKQALQVGDTFSGLVRAYTLSVEFGSKLSTVSQGEYRRMLKQAEIEFGKMPREVLSDARVKRDFLEWRSVCAKASGFREADNRLSVVSAMLTWAVANGRLTANHLKGFSRLYHSDRSERIWSADDVRAFMAVAPIELQTALIIALHTGQRQGDILKLAWSAYDGQFITIRQSKGVRHGKPSLEVTIPCTIALKRLLDGMPRVSPLVLTTKTNRAFKKRYFCRLWEDTTRHAGLENLHFHDLRGTAVTLLSEAGATPQQIATITGHTLNRVSHILDRYLARTRALAEAAIVHWENSPRTEFANQLQTKALVEVVESKKLQQKQ